MPKKWNLQDIVPPERARRAGASAPQVPAPSTIRQTPPREMRVRPGESGHATQAPEDRAPSRGPQRPGVRPAPQVSDRRAPPARGLNVYAQDTEESETESDQQGYMVPARARDPIDTTVARLEVTDGRLARIRKYILAGVAFAIIGFVGISATILMSGAEVTVKPKVHESTVQASFTAELKPDAGELGYELLTLEEEAERQVPATGKQEVSEKAKGEITVYNGHSPTPQKLVKNTRFEAPGGLIFRISDGITIPGYKKDASGGVVPGTVKAKVIADGTGENYNVSDVRLTVPGLKGSDQFDSVYGEVSKAGITGGFEGMKFTIDQTELATTKQKLHTELRDKLLARIGNERPNGFIVYDPAITFVYDSLPAGDAGGQTAVIKERARLFVPLFNEIAFASFIAKSAVPSYGGEPVRLDNPMALTYAYEQSVLEDISKLDSLSFTLTGTAKLIWKFDPESLKSDLVGAPEDSLPAVLAKYPAIDKAKAIIRPIWKNSFPKNPENITVTEVMEMP